MFFVFVDIYSKRKLATEVERAQKAFDIELA